MNQTGKIEQIESLLKEDRFSEVEKMTITKALKKVLEGENVRLPKYSLSEIAEQVEKKTGVSLDRMNANKRRFTEVVQARQFAHYKARLFTIETLAYIGAYFGHKDHATVLYSKKTIEGLLSIDKEFRKENEKFLNN